MRSGVISVSDGEAHLELIAGVTDEPEFVGPLLQNINRSRELPVGV